MKQISKAQIRRLRLRDGDIVLVRDLETGKALANAAQGMKEKVHCPIVFAPQGVHRLSKEYIAKLIGANR